MRIGASLLLNFDVCRLDVVRVDSGLSLGQVWQFSALVETLDEAVRRCVGVDAEVLQATAA